MEDPAGGPPEPIKLTITLNPDMNVTVSGPVGNKLVCYGMLEMAKEAISRQQIQPTIAPASHIPAGLPAIDELSARRNRPVG